MFSTPERVAILRRIIYRIEPVSVGRVARETSLSKGLVSKYLGCLLDEGVLEKSGAQYVARDGVETRAIKLLLNLDGVASFPFGKYPFVRSVGVYGSSAKGSNTERSDIDLWLYVGEADDEVLADLTGELRRCLGDARPLYLTEEKLGLLRGEDSSFYYSLLYGSVAIYGDGLEAV